MKFSDDYIYLFIISCLTIIYAIEIPNSNQP